MLLLEVRLRETTRHCLWLTVQVVVHGGDNISVVKEGSRRCFNGNYEEYGEAFRCPLLLLHCNTSATTSVGTEEKVIAGHAGCAVGTSAYYFRRGGKDKRVPFVGSMRWGDERWPFLFVIYST